MLLVDDLLAAPFKGVFWIFRKIHQATTDELDKRQRQTRADLSELYMQLETGRISESEFDAKEKELLDRLDQVTALRQGKTSSDSGHAPEEAG